MATPGEKAPARSPAVTTPPTSPPGTVFVHCYTTRLTVVKRPEVAVDVDGLIKLLMSAVKTDAKGAMTVENHLKETPLIDAIIERSM